MSVMITSVAEVKKAATPEGFRQFCKEYGFPVEGFKEPKSGVMIDSFDILRFGMQTAVADLKASARMLIGA